MEPFVILEPARHMRDLVYGGRHPFPMFPWRLTWELEFWLCQNAEAGWRVIPRGGQGERGTWSPYVIEFESWNDAAIFKICWS